MEEYLNKYRQLMDQYNITQKEISDLKKQVNTYQNTLKMIISKKYIMILKN